ncbi:MAG: hypothetical protein M1828_006003 [Chrysothrix sp. TS-e1954]|nr:MAG: hypothetical protein M1828_006003 [Chrysothrix sp. TS-e1954]
MSPNTNGLSLSYDLESEDDEPVNRDTNSITKMKPTNTRNAPTSKVSTKRAATKVTKPIKPGKTAKSNSSIGVKKAGAKGRGAPGRSALKDISNAPQQSDQEEVDDFDVSQSIEGPIPDSVMEEPPSEAPKVNTRGTKPNVGTQDASRSDKVPQSQEEQNATKSMSRNVKANKSKPAKAAVPQTQQSRKPSNAEEAEPEPERTETAPSQLVARPSARGNASSRSRMPPTERWRKGSGSDIDHGGSDPLLRRKLNDMTRRFEALEVRYQDLEQVGLKEAESNFDKLKEHSEKRAKAANDLITSLRSELAEQKTLATQVTTLRNTNADIERKASQLTTDNTALRSTLKDAHNEVKALEAKVATMRPNLASIDNGHGRAPNSASNNNVARSGFVGNNNDVAKRALKEELYSDLTGLIILDVRRRDEDARDVYDCIQTGRNGTPSGKQPPKTPSGAHAFNVERADVEYTPFLDPTNDQSLLEILPNYLSEDIGFTRDQAGGFYSKIKDCLTEKLDRGNDKDDDDAD